VAGLAAKETPSRSSCRRGDRRLGGGAAAGAIVSSAIVEIRVQPRASPRACWRITPTPATRARLLSLPDSVATAPSARWLGSFLSRADAEVVPRYGTSGRSGTPGSGAAAASRCRMTRRGTVRGGRRAARGVRIG